MRELLPEVKPDQGICLIPFNDEDRTLLQEMFDEIEITDSSQAFSNYQKMVMSQNSDNYFSAVRNLYLIRGLPSTDTYQLNHYLKGHYSFFSAVTAKAGESGIELPVIDQEVLWHFCLEALPDGQAREDLIAARKISRDICTRLPAMTYASTVDFLLKEPELSEELNQREKGYIPVLSKTLEKRLTEIPKLEPYFHSEILEGRRKPSRSKYYYRTFSKGVVDGHFLFEAYYNRSSL